MKNNSKRSFITHTKYSSFTSDQEFKMKAKAEDTLVQVIQGEDDLKSTVFDELATELSDLALMWTTPARDPMHLRSWKVRLEREWPELHGAIDRLAKRVAADV